MVFRAKEQKGQKNEGYSESTYGNSQDLVQGGGFGPAKVLRHFCFPKITILNLPPCSFLIYLADNFPLFYFFFNLQGPFEERSCLDAVLFGFWGFWPIKKTSWWTASVISMIQFNLIFSLKLGLGSS